MPLNDPFIGTNLGRLEPDEKERERNKDPRFQKPAFRAMVAARSSGYGPTCVFFDRLYDKSGIPPNWTPSEHVEHGQSWLSAPVPFAAKPPAPAQPPDAKGEEAVKPYEVGQGTKFKGKLEPGGPSGGPEYHGGTCWD